MRNLQVNILPPARVRRVPRLASGVSFLAINKHHSEGIKSPVCVFEINDLDLCDDGGIINQTVESIINKYSDEPSMHAISGESLYSASIVVSLDTKYVEISQTGGIL